MLLRKVNKCPKFFGQISNQGICSPSVVVREKVLSSSLFVVVVARDPHM